MAVSLSTTFTLTYCLRHRHLRQRGKRDMWVIFVFAARLANNHRAEELALAAHFSNHSCALWLEI